MYKYQPPNYQSSLGGRVVCIFQLIKGVGIKYTTPRWQGGSLKSIDVLNITNHNNGIFINKLSYMRGMFVLPFLTMCNLHKDTCQTYYITHAIKEEILNSHTVVLEDPGPLLPLAGLLGLGLTCLICLCKKKAQNLICLLGDKRCIPQGNYRLVPKMTFFNVEKL